MTMREDEDPQRIFFDDVRARSEAAVAACGAVVRDIMLAGQHIRFVFAGPALERLLIPAIEHLRGGGTGEPDLLCYVWDSKSSGVAMAPAPVASGSFSERGDIAGFDGSPVLAAFQPSDYSLSLFDRDARVGVYWLEEAEGLPYWTQAAPFRALFHWWVEQAGGVLVHGAAVGNEDGGVLITGKGGIGKSTTALSCLAAGFAYVGDDYVAIFPGSPVTAHSVYCTAKLNPDNAARFAAFGPRLVGDRAVRGEGKMVAFLREHVASSIAIRAVLTPRFAARPESAIQAADPASLLVSATATSLAQLPLAGLTTIDRVAQVLERLPGHVIRLGTMVDEIPQLIARLLRDPGRPGPGAARLRDLPFLSLVVRVKGEASPLTETFADIVAQGCPRLEAIIVDGGAAGLETVVETLPFQPRIIRHEGGLPDGSPALETVGATGEVVLILEAGERLVAGALRPALEMLRDNPDVDAVGGRAEGHRASTAARTLFRCGRSGGLEALLPGPLIREAGRSAETGDAHDLALGLARQALGRKRAIAS